MQGQWERGGYLTGEFNVAMAGRIADVRCTICVSRGNFVGQPKVTVRRRLIMVASSILCFFSLGLGAALEELDCIFRTACDLSTSTRNRSHFPVIFPYRYT